MPEQDRRVGFRFSARDAFVLLFATGASVATWGLPGRPGAAIAIVVGHFFLFCNVVRLRRSYELAWAAIFVVVVAALAAFSVPRWDWALPLVSPFTVAFVVLEVRSSQYRGVWASRIRPNGKARPEEAAGQEGAGRSSRNSTPLS